SSSSQRICKSVERLRVCLCSSLSTVTIILTAFQLSLFINHVERDIVFEYRQFAQSITRRESNPIPDFVSVHDSTNEKIGSDVSQFFQIVSIKRTWIEFEIQIRTVQQFPSQFLLNT